MLSPWNAGRSLSNSSRIAAMHSLARRSRAPKLVRKNAYSSAIQPTPDTERQTPAAAVLR